MTPNESILLELKKIEQMSDCGSHELTIMRMKSIATEAIKKWEDSSGKETGMKWVKASERLPQDEKPHYVKCKSGEMNVAYYLLEDENRWIWNAQGYDGKPFDVEDGYITEWLDESVSPYKEEEKTKL